MSISYPTQRAQIVVLYYEINKILYVYSIYLIYLR